jgi:hypothetical protein
MARNHSPLWPDRRVKPPYGSVEIDRGHPLAPSNVWLMNEGVAAAVDAVTGRVSTPSGSTITPGASERGPILTFATTGCLLIPNPQIAAYPITVWGWVMCANDGSVSQLFWGIYTAGTQWLALGPSTVESGAFCTGGQGEGVSGATVASYFSSTRLNHVVCVYSSATVATIYINGVNYTTGVASAWTSRTTSYLAARATPTPALLRGSLGHVGIIPRGLTQSEVLTLYADPYCFLRPLIRRSYGFVGAAAPASYYFHAMRTRFVPPLLGGR